MTDITRRLPAAGWKERKRTMDNDDLPVGRILSRREALVLLGAASAAMGAAALAACAPANATAVPATVSSGLANATGTPTAAATLAGLEAQTAVAAGNPTGIATAQVQNTAVAAANATALPACVVRPELTEGPYFVDEKLNRSNIRSDPSDNTVKEGAPFELTIRVSQVGSGGCTALAGAQVDLWHCDALGVYSDANDPNFGSTKGKKFLRGYQLTDANGIAKFTTIYPGWYRGRAVHIHFKIRTPSGNQNYDFASQFFFDEAVSAQVYTREPYASKGAQGFMRNNQDGIYQQSGGQTLLDAKQSGDGYAGTFDVGLQI